MKILSVQNLCKTYKNFSLKDVSFELQEGTITGFVGKNGAGKTTTIKSILGYVCPDKGNIKIFDKDFKDDLLEIKQEIGYASGTLEYYPKKKLKTLTNITKCFYKNWDEEVYRKLLKQFNLDEEKTPSQLSQGMKVKYAVSIALSHHAKLLILDEPTSGLDPESRVEILDLFLELVEDFNTTILFSTHITTDLEKSADNIIHIRNGEIVASSKLEKYLAKYKVATVDKDSLTDDLKSKLIGLKRSKSGYSGLIKSSEINEFKDVQIKDADLEDVVIYTDKEVK